MSNTGRDLFDGFMVAVASDAAEVIERATSRSIRTAIGVSAFDGLEDLDALRLATRLGRNLAEASVQFQRRKADVLDTSRHGPARDLDRYTDSSTLDGRDQMVRQSTQVGYLAAARFGLHAYRDNDVFRQHFSNMWDCAAFLLKNDRFIEDIVEAASMTRRGLYRDHFADLTTILHPEFEHWRKVLGIAPDEPIVNAQERAGKLSLALNPLVSDGLKRELRARNRTRPVRRSIVQNDQECPAAAASKGRVEESSELGVHARSGIAIGCSLMAATLEVALGTIETKAINVSTTRPPSMGL